MLRKTLEKNYESAGRSSGGMEQTFLAEQRKISDRWRRTPQRFVLRFRNDLVPFFLSATSKAEVLSLYELGNLMLHGQTRPIDLRVVNTQLHCRRTAVLKQTELGIKPITVGRGTIKVKDEVKIHFDIVILQRQSTLPPTG